MRQSDSLLPIRLISFPQSFPAKPLSPLPTDLRELRLEEFLKAQSRSVSRQSIHRAWENFQSAGFGFPRFKKYGQFKFLLFPQFQKNPVTGGCAIAATGISKSRRQRAVIIQQFPVL